MSLGHYYVPLDTSLKSVQYILKLIPTNFFLALVEYSSFRQKRMCITVDALWHGGDYLGQIGTRHL